MIGVEPQKMQLISRASKVMGRQQPRGPQEGATSQRPPPSGFFGVLSIVGHWVCVRAFILKAVSLFVLS